MSIIFFFIVERMIYLGILHLNSCEYRYYKKYKSILHLFNHASLSITIPRFSRQDSLYSLSIFGI